MTMKYTHIGIQDQAKALAALPTAALQMRCIPGGSDRLEESPDVSDSSGQKRQNPCSDAGFDAERHSVSRNAVIEATGIEPASFGRQYLRESVVVSRLGGATCCNSRRQLNSAYSCPRVGRIQLTDEISPSAW
jgi:hypothetical protein